jgi:hypothetical protein
MTTIGFDPGSNVRGFGWWQEAEDQVCVRRRHRFGVKDDLPGVERCREDNTQGFLWNVRLHLVTWVQQVDLLEFWYFQ